VLAVQDKLKLKRNVSLEKLTGVPKVLFRLMLTGGSLIF